MRRKSNRIKIGILLLPVLMFLGCSKGEKVIVTKFQDGTPAIIQYTKKGQKVYEEFYYTNKQLRAEGKWNGKQKTGVWKYYFDDGVLFAKADFTDSRDGKNWQIYQGKDNLLVDKNDSIKAMAFSPEGTLVTITVLQDGHEVFYRFHKSFHLWEKINLKGNIPNGLSMSWHENGKVNSEAYYRDGMQDSIYVAYSETGQKIVSGQYRMDKKVGKWEFFSSEGNPLGVTYYDQEGIVLKDSRNDGLKYHRAPLNTQQSTTK